MGTLTREFTIKKERVLDAEARTVKATLSTEHPVQRWNGHEVLSHADDAIILKRAPLPLIIAHDDSRLPVGVVEQLTIEDKKLKGVLRFSKSKTHIWGDVTDGILRNLSIGYRVYAKTAVKDGTYTATKWEPFECSLVAAGADPQAQIGRKYNKGNKKMDINDLKQTRKENLEKMKELAATDGLTEEQETELRDLKASTETLELRIASFEMSAKPAKEKPAPRIEIAEPSSRDFRQDKEYSRIYEKFLREGRQSLYADEVRALTVGSDPSMGFAVPESFEQKLVKALDENNIMRSICKVIKTSSDRKIPIVTGNTTAYWINESGDYTASDVTLAQKTLGAHKLGVLTLASEELAHDLSFNLSNFLAEDFGQSMGDKEEDAFIDGDGVDKPSGILLDSVKGKEASSGTAITADEIIDLIHSLGRAYRKRASFLMNDDTLKLLRKLKDDNDAYIYQESLQAGEPSTLFGRPVHISDAMPEPTTGNKAILFGDFSYYWIADRQGRYFQELRELYAASGQIGYRANQRIDGKLILPEAMKHLVMG